jgi:copper chaperone
MQFHIANMECGGCARGVTRAIQSVDPKAIVETDPPARRVTVQSEQPQTAFLPALEAAGFPATPA